MDAGTTGTILELQACEWLLQHGFKVWRAVGGSQTGDLVAETPKGGKLFEVEVRAGKLRKNRPGVYFRQLPQDTADLYLVIVPGTDRIYWRVPPDGESKRSLLQAYPVAPRLET